MPYKMDGSDAPDHVQGAAKRRQWSAVWNSAHGRCMKQGGDDKKCEAAAFAQANGVVKAAEATLEDQLW